MSGTGAILDDKARVLRDSLARQSLTGQSDPLRFQQLLDGVRRVALIPQCPKEILHEIERLLKESVQLNIKKDREAFAFAVSPLASRFDKADWAVTLERAISRNSPWSSKLLQAAQWSEIRLSQKDLASLFRAVGNRPNLLATFVSFAAMHGTTKEAIELNGSAIKFVHALRNRLASPTTQSHHLICVCMFIAIATNGFAFPVAEEKRRLLAYWWSKAVTEPVSDTHFSLLVEACGVCHDRDRFTELTSEWRLKRIGTTSALINLINTALQLGDRACLGRLLSIALQRPESPFDLREQGIWMSLLQGSLDLKDDQVFMRIFEHLHSRFNYLRLRDWGPLSKQIRNALFLLPKDEAARVRRVFYYDEIDADQCIEALKTAPLPDRRSGKGDWPFVGAGRVLMRWLINGYISHSADVLRERVEVVADGVLSFPRERQHEATYQLLARGQGVYAGAISERPLQGIKDICLQLQSLSDTELRESFEAPQAIRDQICALISPPDFPEPPPLPTELGSMADIANLTLVNQRDFLNGVIWIEGEWFTRLSPLVDRLCCECSSREGWVTAFLWFIETITHGVSGLMSGNSHAHQFKNEFDWEWLPSMVEAAHDPTQTNALRARFIDRVEGFLVSRTWIYGGERERCRVDRVFERVIQEWRERWEDNPIANQRIAFPRPFALWMLKGERESTLLPLFREVLDNAFKALEPLHSQSRLFRFEVTIEDECWAKLSVRNSHDPWSERASSTGRGQSIIDGFCKRLRSRDNQVKTPRHHENVGEPGFPTSGHLKVFEQEVYLPLAGAVMAKEL